MSTVVPIKAPSEPAPIKPTASGAGRRPLLRLSDISKSFSGGTTALAGVDLTIYPGEFVSLLGPSGCGKSTLLKLIAGLASPTSGTIDWPQSTYTAEGVPEPALGFVFQEPTLLPWRTAANNVQLPLLLAGVDKHEAQERVSEALALVGLASLLPPLSAAIVGRNEDARVDRAGAGDAAENPADGRALRRARRNHPHEAQRRTAGSCLRGRT